MKASENRHYKVLELDKVLHRLAELTTCEDAKWEAERILPCTSLVEAQVLLNQTEAAYLLLAKFGGPSFGSMKNVNNALFRASAGGALTMKELLDIAEDLRVIRSVSEWRFRQPGADSCLDLLFGALMPQRLLEETIVTSIVSEEEMSDRASPALADIRRKMRQQAQNIRDKLDGMVHSAHYKQYLQDAIITQRNGRFVVPVKNEFRGNVPGLVHDTSGSGSTVFIEPMAVVEANNEIRVLQGKEREEIDRILAELSAQAGEVADTVKHSYECLVELNLIFAKARLAYDMNASVPVLNEDGITVLNKARHPLLNKKTVVPVDISLGDRFDTLMITGPNTGGKTVSIKTLGLLTLMAACGLMVPCADETKICIYRKVFADIGDEQSIEQSLSTFSSHMTNIINIIKESDTDSLVLIDELGAGTDPVEGAALAMAILERLHFNGSKIAATTHYAELKAYALQTARVENGSCEFDVQSLRPTYRLLIGVPGRSNAFAITERLGMDMDVILRAKELVEADDLKFEDVVDSLEESRLKMEEERDEVAEKRAEAEKALAEAQKKLAEAEDLRKREYEKAQTEALRITENARREANALLMEVERFRKDMKTTKDAADLAAKARSAMKKDLSNLDSAVNPVVTSLYEDEDYVLPRPLVTGDRVLIADIGREADVMSPADRKGNVEVLAGSARMRVQVSRLRLLEKKKEKKKTVFAPTVARSESRLTASAENRVDLRGMNKEEALFTLDAFIDSMLLSGLQEFTVIHGKGTGVLREAVQHHLKNNKFVKTHRPGLYGEGENGVTIVTLK
ncbi:MAG: endonuclease MutS2 [Clostridia bacterium]|nr:endonuclease MutS2 [Clostridia bacterium]